MYGNAWISGTRLRIGMTCPNDKMIGRVAEVEVLSNPLAVAGAELIDAKRRRDEPNRATPRAVAALHHVAHVPIDTDHQRASRSVQHSQGRAIHHRDECAKKWIGVHQRGVDGQHTRHSASPCNPRGHERQVEELAVLMHHVGTGLVEDPLHTPHDTWAEHERQCVVEGQVAWRDGPRGNAHHVDSVEILPLGCALDRRGGNPDLMTLPHVLAGDIE